MPWTMRQIFKALWAAVLTLILYFSGFLVMWTPFPLFSLSLQREKRLWGFSFGCVVAMAFVIYFGILPGQIPVEGFSRVQILGLSYLGFYLLISFLLAVGVWKNFDLIRLGVILGMSVTGVVFLVGFSIHTSGLFDVEALIATSLRELSLLLDQMRNSFLGSQNRVETLNFIAQMKEWIVFLPKLFPSFVFILTLSVLVFNIGSTPFFTKDPKVLKWIHDFKSLQIPYLFVWLMILGGFSFFLDYYWLQKGFLKWFAFNLFIAIGFVYFVQGFSILAFFLKRTSLLFRFGIYGLLIVFFQMLGLVVVGLGVADTWLDFRRLHAKLKR